MNATERAAAAIVAARRERIPLGPLPEADRPRDEAEAYRVQRLASEHFASDLGAVVGYKIGCTTLVMQAFLGIPDPCYGRLRTNRVWRDHVDLGAADHIRIGVECEIGMTVAHPDVLLAADSPGAAMAAVASVHAAIELVDERYEDWRALDAPTLVADDFFSAGAVLGPAVPAGEIDDLTTVLGKTRINDMTVGEGTGSDVMDHPANALVWLARKLRQTGDPLGPGDVVLTGSLVETRWLEPGDRAEIAIGRLGRASVAVGAA